MSELKRQEEGINQQLKQNASMIQSKDKRIIHQLEKKIHIMNQQHEQQEQVRTETQTLNCLQTPVCNIKNHQ